MKSRYSNKAGIAVVAVFLSLITVFFFASEIEEREKHLKVLDHLSILKQEDILLSEDILKAHGGFLKNYDSIVAIKQNIETILAEVNEIYRDVSQNHWFAVAMHPNFNQLLSDQADISVYLTAYIEDFNARKVEVERFKTLNATIQNSQSSFIVLLDELVSALREKPDAQQAILDVELLLYDTTLFLARKEKGRFNKVEKDLEQVRSIADQYPDLKNLSDTLARHGSIIARLEKDISHLVESITDPDHLTNLKSMHVSYKAFFDILYNIGADYTAIMFGAALALLLTILFIWFRLFRTNNLLANRTANVELLQNVALAANQAQSLDDAIQRILKLVCDFTGWSVGHAYYHDVQTDTLVPSCLWFMSDPELFKSFQKITENSIFERGKGLPGRVLANKEPVWIPDVQNDSNFPRNKHAADIGVHAGLAFPVFVGDEVVAVLEFFSEYALEPEQGLLSRVAVIGTQLGRVVERIKTHEVQDALIEERTAELNNSKERFELAVDGTNDGIWDWPDVTRDEEYWSPQFKKLLGYEDHEIQASYGEFGARLHPDDLERVGNEVKQHFENHIPFDTEYRLRTKSGDYRWFRAKGTTVRDSQGTPLRMAGSLSDITSRKENEVKLTQFADEIQNSQARLEGVLSTVLDGIMTIDSGGIVQSMNPAAEQIFGYEAHEVIGKNVKMLMPSRYEREHDQYLDNYLGGGTAKVIGIGREVEAMRKDGSTFPMELGVSEVSISDERTFVGIVRDISDRKQAEADLIDAKNNAEEATRLKSEFLANMSHEIRTPMNGVIGMTNLLLETELNAVQKTYAGTVMSSADNLLQLVNDILDFSKIEAGKLELEIIPFDLQALVEEVADLIAVKAQENGLEMLLRFAPELPRYIMGDPGRIRQVFLNLASNALKFTEAGHVFINLSHLEVQDGQVTFRATIEDTGIGIPEDKQDYIFNKFHQADGSTTRKFGGTGLGLAICKELIHMMEGDIGVDSIEGVGSTFWFTFRLDLDANIAERGSLELSADLSGVRAIIIDDNKVAQDIAREQMHAQKMDITVTSSATEGFNAMKFAASEGKPYEMAILDYMMPGMDGVELARAIKEEEVLQDTSLLMISSAPSRGDNERMQQLGFSGYLTKPTSGHDIIKALCAIKGMRDGKTGFEMVTRHALREAASRDDDATTETANFDSAQILLAEDNRVNQMVATALLTKMGCHVTPAGNGLEAVKLMKQRSFDLVFMDCNMPEMDGFEATGIIRNLEKRENFDRTPIIAFTAYAMKGDDQKCYDAGMDDYITKPVKKQAVIKVLNKWLVDAQSSTAEPVELEADAVEEPLAVQLTADAEPEVEMMSEENGSDLSEAAEVADALEVHDTPDWHSVVNDDVYNQMKELMGEEFAPMIDQYLKDSNDYIRQAEEAVADGNADLLLLCAHSLKSSSASLGVIKLPGLASEIEAKSSKIIKNGEGSVEDLSLEVKELSRSFAEAESAFKSRRS